MANKRRTRTRTNLTTFGADFGSIAGLDFNKFNSLPFSFVLDETLQLKETPIANPIVHSSSKISSSNPFEVFHNNFASFKIANNFLANAMVNCSHEPSLSSRNLLQKPSGASSAFALQFTSQEFESPFNLFNFRGMEELIVRGDCEIMDSQVHAQNSLRNRALGRKLLGECEEEKASAFRINSQKAFINFPAEIIFKAIRDFKGDFNSSFDCRDTQDIILEREASRGVVSNRTELNNWLGLGSFNHSTSLFNAGNRQLSRKPKFFQSRINKWMQLDVVRNSEFPSFINTHLQSFFIDHNSSNNLFAWFNSNLCCCSVSHRLYTNSNYLNLTGGISPPKAKAMGIRDARFI